MRAPDLTESCLKAYRACLYAGMLPGQLEASTLIKLAMAMDLTQRDKAYSGRRSQIFLMNYELWQQFNQACADPRCTLDKKTRGDIVSLAAFVEKRTRKIIVARQPQAAEVGTLVTINRNFGNGLFAATGRDTRADNPATRAVA